MSRVICETWGLLPEPYQPPLSQSLVHRGRGWLAAAMQTHCPALKHPGIKEAPAL